MAHPVTDDGDQLYCREKEKDYAICEISIHRQNPFTDSQYCPCKISTALMIEMFFSRFCRYVSISYSFGFKYLEVKKARSPHVTLWKVIQSKLFCILNITESYLCFSSFPNDSAGHQERASMRSLRLAYGIPISSSIVHPSVSESLYTVST